MVLKKQKYWFGLASWETYGMKEAKLHDQKAKGQLLKAGSGACPGAGEQSAG